MERRLRLSPGQQVFMDLAHQVPAMETLSVETYLFFQWIARDIFAAQQTFFGRFELSEGKLVLLLLLHQALHSRLTPSQLAEAAEVTPGLCAATRRSRPTCSRVSHPHERP